LEEVSFDSADTPPSAGQAQIAGRIELRGDGLDSLRLFLEAMAKAGNFDWLGNPEPYTRDLPDKHPDKVESVEDLVTIWRRSLQM